MESVEEHRGIMYEFMITSDSMPILVNISDKDLGSKIIEKNIDHEYSNLFLSLREDKEVNNNITSKFIHFKLEIYRGNEFIAINVDNASDSSLVESVNAKENRSSRDKIYKHITDLLIDRDYDVRLFTELDHEDRTMISGLKDVKITPHNYTVQ